jgi:hypothetical protein
LVPSDFLLIREDVMIVVADNVLDDDEVIAVVAVVEEKSHLLENAEDHELNKLVDVEKFVRMELMLVDLLREMRDDSDAENEDLVEVYAH